PRRSGERCSFVVPTVLPSKTGGIDAMNSRRCVGKTAEPLLSVGRFENYVALESRDQRRRNAAVFSIGIQGDKFGRWQARSRCVPETHAFANGDVRLCL